MVTMANSLGDDQESLHSPYCRPVTLVTLVTVKPVPISQQQRFSEHHLQE